MTDPKLLIWMSQPRFCRLRRLKNCSIPCGVCGIAVFSILFISTNWKKFELSATVPPFCGVAEVTGNIDPRDHDAHELARLMIGRDMVETTPPAPSAAGEKRLEVIGTGKQA